MINMNLKSKKFILPIISLVIVLSCTLSFYFVQASNTIFKESDSNWEDYNDELATKREDTYPYNADILEEEQRQTNENASLAVDEDERTIQDESFSGYTASSTVINSVSLDVIYGTTRDLVKYHGEVPYVETTNDKDPTDLEPMDFWEDYYSEGIDISQGSSLKKITNTNPDYQVKGDSNTDVSIDISWTLPAASYWGKQLVADVDSNGLLSDGDEGNQKLYNVHLLESEVNGGSISSLRLYALAKTDTSWFNFGNLLYSMNQGLAKFASWILSLFVSIKNISSVTILNALGFQKLEKVMTKVLLFDLETKTVSPFLIIFSLCFLMTLFGVVKQQLKGGPKLQSALSPFLSLIFGIALVMVCLFNGSTLTSLGGNIANTMNSIIYAIASASTGGSAENQAFNVDIDDSFNKNQVVAIQEMSLINKSFMDIQIGTQFGVNDIDDLKITNLGDTDDGQNARLYLAGLNSSSFKFKQAFNNNLGYYYWFANSSSTQYSEGNKEFPKTAVGASTYKLSSMITYLQVLHNNTTSTQTKQTIENIILSFADPHCWYGTLYLLLYIVVLVLLLLVLWKYVLKILFAKLEMLIALLLVVPAGPFMIAGSQKTKGWAKNILGMFLCSLFEITFYSMFFDIVLYLISMIVSPNLFRLIIAIVLLILLLFYNKYIEQKISQFINNVEQSNRKMFGGATGTYQRAKRDFFNKLNTGSHALSKKWDESQKFMGNDANGNPMYSARKGGLVSKVLNRVANETETDPRRKKRFMELGKELKKARKEEKQKLEEKERVAAEERTRAELEKIKKEAEAKELAMKAEIQEEIDATKKRDLNGNLIEGQYNEEQLNDQELALLNKAESLSLELTNLTNSDEFKALQERKQEIELNNQGKPESEHEHLSAAEEARLKQYIDTQLKLTKDTNAAYDEVEGTIRNRLTRKIFRHNHFNYDVAEGNTDDAKIKNVTKQEAQSNHKDELRACIQTTIAATRKGANDKHFKGKDKLDPNKSSLNEKSMGTYMGANIQLKQLDNGLEVSNLDEAKEIGKDVLKKTIASYNGVELSPQEKVERAKAKKGKKACRKLYAHGEAGKQLRGANKHVEEAMLRNEELVSALTNDKKAVKALKKKAREDNNHLIFTSVSERLDAGVDDLFKEHPEKFNPKIDKSENSTPRSTRHDGDKVPPSPILANRQAEGLRTKDLDTVIVANTNENVPDILITSEPGKLTEEELQKLKETDPKLWNELFDKTLETDELLKIFEQLKDTDPQALVGLFADAFNEEQLEQFKKENPQFWQGLLDAIKAETFKDDAIDVTLQATIDADPEVIAIKDEITNVDSNPELIQLRKELEDKLKELSDKQRRYTEDLSKVKSHIKGENDAYKAELEKINNDKSLKTKLKNEKLKGLNETHEENLKNLKVATEKELDRLNDSLDAVIKQREEVSKDYQGKINNTKEKLVNDLQTKLSDTRLRKQTELQSVAQAQKETTKEQPTDQQFNFNINGQKGQGQSADTAPKGNPISDKAFDNILKQNSDAAAQKAVEGADNVDVKAVEVQGPEYKSQNINAGVNQAVKTTANATNNVTGGYVGRAESALKDKDFTNVVNTTVQGTTTTPKTPVVETVEEVVTPVAETPKVAPKVVNPNVQPQKGSAIPQGGADRAKADVSQKEPQQIISPDSSIETFVQETIVEQPRVQESSGRPVNNGNVQQPVNRAAQNANPVQPNTGNAQKQPDNIISSLDASIEATIAGQKSQTSTPQSQPVYETPQAGSASYKVPPQAKPVEPVNIPPVQSGEQRPPLNQSRNDTPKYDVPPQAPPAGRPNVTPPEQPNYKAPQGQQGQPVSGTTPPPTSQKTSWRDIFGGSEQEQPRSGSSQQSSYKEPVKQAPINNENANAGSENSNFNGQNKDNLANRYKNAEKELNPKGDLLNSKREAMNQQNIVDAMRAESSEDNSFAKEQMANQKDLDDALGNSKRTFEDNNNSVQAGYNGQAKVNPDKDWDYLNNLFKNNDDNNN